MFMFWVFSSCFFIFRMRDICIVLKLYAVILASHLISGAPGTSTDPLTSLLPPQQPKVLCRGKQTLFLQKGPTLKFLGILQKVLPCSLLLTQDLHQDFRWAEEAAEEQRLPPFVLWLPGTQLIKGTWELQLHASKDRDPDLHLHWSVPPTPGEQHWL